MEEMYQTIITAAALLLCSYTDWKKCRISKKAAAVYAAAALLGRLTEGKSGIAAGIWGTVPGIVFLFLSFLTRQGIGYGDSILMVLLGLSLGMEEAMGVILLALFLAGIWAVFLLFGKRAAAKQEFPFLPFLLISFAVLQLTKG